jgi:hypothetical protein
MQVNESLPPQFTAPDNFTTHSGDYVLRIVQHEGKEKLVTEEKGVLTWLKATFWDRDSYRSPQISQQIQKIVASSANIDANLRATLCKIEMKIKEKEIAQRIKAMQKESPNELRSQLAKLKDSTNWSWTLNALGCTPSQVGIIQEATSLNITIEKTEQKYTLTLIGERKNSAGDLNSFELSKELSSEELALLLLHVPNASFG